MTAELLFAPEQETIESQKERQYQAYIKQRVMRAYDEMTENGSQGVNSSEAKKIVMQSVKEKLQKINSSMKNITYSVVYEPRALDALTEISLYYAEKGGQALAEKMFDNIVLQVDKLEFMPFGYQTTDFAKDNRIGLTHFKRFRSH